LEIAEGEVGKFGNAIDFREKRFGQNSYTLYRGEI
jgi:hypothetical protein